jgi:hypothetical protein
MDFVYVLLAYDDPKISNPYVEIFRTPNLKYYYTGLNNKEHGFMKRKEFNYVGLPANYVVDIIIPIHQKIYKYRNMRDKDIYGVLHTIDEYNSGRLRSHGYHSKMMILGKKYSLLDTKTYELFELDIKQNLYFTYFVFRDGRIDLLDKIEKNDPNFIHDNSSYLKEYTIDIASINGHVSILKWCWEHLRQWSYSSNAIDKISKNHIKVLNFWKYMGLPLKYTSKAMDLASINGNRIVLDWWLYSGLKLRYTYHAINNASSNGKIKILEWWFHSGLELKYNEKAMDQASQNGHIAVLDWWKENRHLLILKYSIKALIKKISVQKYLLVLEWWRISGLKMKYDEGPINEASENGHISILEWWLNSGLPLKYNNNALMYATMNCRLNVLEWWVKSGLQLKYDKTIYIIAICYGTDQIIQWWKNHGSPDNDTIENAITIVCKNGLREFKIYTQTSKSSIIVRNQQKSISQLLERWNRY